MKKQVLFSFNQRQFSKKRRQNTSQIFFSDIILSWDSIPLHFWPRISLELWMTGKIYSNITDWQFYPYWFMMTLLLPIPLFPTFNQLNFLSKHTYIYVVCRSPCFDISWSVFPGSPLKAEAWISSHVDINYWISHLVFCGKQTILKEEWYSSKCGSTQPQNTAINLRKEVDS